MAIAGFKFSHRLTGTGVTIHEVKPKAGVTALAIGDLVNIESGKADLAATNDTALCGVVYGPGLKAADQTPTDLTAIGANDTIAVICDNDAVYQVVDANARVYGEKLDITGTTGAMGVGAPTNNDLVVVAPSTANQPTLVKISDANHVVAGV